LDDKELKAESTNISEGGMALVLHHALPKNATPRLRFTLPGTSLRLDVETEVAWADLKGCVGLRFLNVPVSSQALLERWLTDHMEQQLPASKDKPAAPSAPSLP
jgi:c-di-GMP-binding flagellar brake protein YcgR